MADRTHNRPRPSWIAAALGTALGITIAGVGLFSTALAVHDAEGPFELDGNATDPAGGDDDWQGVFGLNGVTPPATGSPIASSNSVFIKDTPPTNQAGLPSNQETMYNAGKDTLDVTAWTRKLVTKVTPDKDNIVNAYAKSYSVDHDGLPGTPNHTYIYFGADRLANNGDAALGFWFFQNKVNLTGTNGFSPAHTARTATTRGDILVQVDFVSGGSSSEIQVFEWVGTFDADGDGDPGGDFGPLQELAFDQANGETVCAALNGTADVACATTNESQTGSYWPYTPKFGQSGFFPPESFFEGGIDLTAFAGDICINSFLANTRTSHSETADLKDLALGDFNTCGSVDLVDKVCSVPEPQTQPVYDPVNDTFKTFHTLTILNDGGGGDIYDVSIRDDYVTAESTCSIVAISGGTGTPSLPIAIADNATFYEVANTLGPGVANQMTVTLECDSPENPFVNKATVRAGQTPGGTSLVDSFEQDDENVPAECVFDAAPSLKIEKSCAGAVTLDSYFQPKVCVDVKITNESSPAQTVDIDTWIDDHNDGSSKDILADEFSGTLALAAGESASYQDCYNPTAQDNPDNTDPGSVTYGDTAKVIGTGRASGSDEAVTETVKCPLCPAPPES